MNARESNLRQRLAVIYGSNRTERLCDKVGAWTLSRVADHGRFEAELIDPIAITWPDRMGDGTHHSLSALRRRIDHAEAFLVITPEYNHGYPATLKLLIDSARAVQRRCFPSAISSMVLETKASRSLGERLVTMPLSTTTSLSTQLAPAFCTSVRMDW